MNLNKEIHTFILNFIKFKIYFPVKMETKFFLFDYWSISQREQIHDEFQSNDFENIKENAKSLIRQSLFKMKLDKSPLFRAQMYCDLIENPQSWRQIRKSFRKFLLDYRNYKKILPDRDYVDEILPILKGTLESFVSQFINWGIVMPDTVLSFTKKSTDNLINLYAGSIEKGYSTLKLPIYSAIVEKFTRKSVESLLFSPPNKDIPGSDFFRLFNSNYIVTKFDPNAMDWLFSSVNMNEEFEPIAELMKHSLLLIFEGIIKEMTEEMEDITDIEFSSLTPPDLNDISEIVLFLYWNQLKLENQVDLLNQSLDISSFVDYIHYLFVIAPHIENDEYFPTFFSLMESWGYCKFFDDLRIKLNDLLVEQSKEEIFSKEFIEELKSFKDSIPNIPTLTINHQILLIPTYFSLGDLDKCINLIDSNNIEQIEYANRESEIFLIEICGLIFFMNNQFERANNYFLILNESEDLKDTIRERYLITMLKTKNKDQYLSEIKSFFKDKLIGVGFIDPSIRDFFWDLFALASEQFVEELLDDLIRRTNLDKFDLCNSFGHVSADLGFFKIGVDFMEKSLEYSKTDGNRATAFNNMGTLYSDWGKYDDAIASFKKALEFDEKFVRAWQNLAKVYSFLGENIKNLECMKKASEMNFDREASISEYYFTQYDADLFSLMAGIDINYNAIANEPIKIHFSTADVLCDKIFPQNEEIQTLASAVFIHYGMGMELLFNRHLGSLSKGIIVNKLGQNLKDLPDEEKKRIPHQLQNLIYNNNVGLGNWAYFLRQLIKKTKKKEFNMFEPIIRQFSEENLKILIESAKFFAKYRNPSSHGEIFSFKIVKKKRMEMIYRINLCLEVFRKNVETG